MPDELQALMYLLMELRPGRYLLYPWSPASLAKVRNRKIPPLTKKDLIYFLQFIELWKISSPSFDKDHENQRLARGGNPSLREVLSFFLS